MRKVREIKKLRLFTSVGINRLEPIYMTFPWPNSEERDREREEII